MGQHDDSSGSRSSLSEDSVSPNSNELTIVTGSNQQIL
jgi:hypothetical protein